MSRNNIYNKVSTLRKMALCSLLFWCFVGTVMAQEAPLYVIKMEGQNNYLSHSGSGNSATLQNATSFSPNCLWYSGPNVEYNYYFIDEAGNYRYLSAPLQLNGELYLTPSHPGTVVLNMASSGQYFYDWDHGVARGEEITGLTSEQCTSTYNGYDPIKDECWKVVWVSYEEYEGNMRWQMSSQYGYNPTTYAARYKSVAKTEHDVDILDTPAPTGGLPSIADFTMTFGDAPHALNGTADAFSCTYRPAYTTYVFDGGTHNYFGDEDHDTDIPGTSTLSDATPISYAWTLTGEGAQYLSLSDDDIPNPTLTYQTENTTTSHKMATLTLTATYEGGVKQVRTVTVTVKTACQNPVQASAPVVTYDNVTLSWVPTAEKYKLQWKQSGQDWSAATEVTDITASSYTFTGSVFIALGYGQAYDYRVSAYCNSSYLDYPTEPSMIYHFSTFAEPGLFIFGSVYGGGRMANVNGNTEVVVIDCDSVKAVYGGNDIAGTVSGSSNIVLGVNESTDPNSDAYKYNNGNASTKVRVFDVYGGGNGYYAYNGTSFTAASSEYYQQEVAVNGVVKAMTQTNQLGEVVWTNESEDPVTLTFPKITSATITVTNDQVRVDSLFGGAKNAFITSMSGNGSDITFNGGTAYAVFGGNNVGGSQGYGNHHISVVNTKTNLTATTGFGRSFGIGYLFGGGNKVYGSSTEIFITGGQCDTVFAGGNSASVHAANVTVNCLMDSGSESTFGSVYTNAITGFTAGNPPTLTMNDSYTWNGTGVYNVRTLFGGNNRAMMTCLPTVTLTSGSVGTVYGGGNAGNMMAQTTGGSITFDSSLDLYNYSFDYSTKVVMNSATMLVDNLYGGCQMSDVGYSTWVQVQGGHVGTVYGGCNISGDVGSTRKDLNQNPNNTNGLYQEVYGTTNVEVSGGTVHKDVFAGSNGFYHCLDAYGISYVEGITYDPAGHSYVGMKVPTHNETHVVISGTAVINNNVYAGGNMAPVGFTSAYINHTPYAYPEYVGLASVRMIGGTVKGSVYGGGRMASITGNNEVRVTGGSIGYDGVTPTGGALYGGNDRLGKAGGISNRVLPAIYNKASDHITPLLSGGSNERVNTYVGVTGNPTINTVYGGGNGAYTYTGPGADMQYCDASDLPIQSNIFVDIAIDGNNGTNGAGYIANVFGGGNGVRAQGFVKVFLNVKNQSGDTQAHVGTIYGGNNMGDMENIVPEIILLHGNVQTVYGGCNSGAMAAVDGHTKSITVGGTTYNNIGSYVRLLSSYDGDGEGGSAPVTPTAVVKGAVYGGCRMNGVTSNSMVIVEGGNHSAANIFGGSDISGDVSGISYVVVNGSYNSGTSTYNGVVNDVYGGGNGNYTYTSGVYEGLNPPYCRDSRVIMLEGQVANLYAGGYAGECGVTTMTVDGGLVTGSVFGGGNRAGTTTSYDLTTTTFDANHVSHTSTTTVTTTGNSSVTVSDGSIHTGVYGGCNTSGNIAGGIEVDVLGGTVGANTSARANVHGGGYGHETHTSGNVTVNIGATTGGENPTYSGTATIYGDIYGGSALGQVSASGLLTQVNFYKGTVNGDVYGGGLGNNDHPAEVSGDVVVNIRGGVFNDADGRANYNDGTPSDGNTYGGCIYGCNNNNGTPRGNVTVNIYATDHGNTVGTNHYPTTTITTVDQLNTNAEEQTYAIKAVFGGGNLAAYVPDDVEAGQDPHSATVHVYNCNNTIEDIFGGGNAANVGSGTVSTGEITRRANTYVIIDGGRMHRVIGGGNGAGLPTEHEGANIFGTANTTVYAGLINEVYGGANIKGSVDAINLDMNHSGACGAEVYGKVFGCANAAHYNRSVTTTIECGVGVIGELYGGSNQANIGTLGQNNADVTLNIYGGNHTQVFAGSKGIAAGSGVTPVEANIYGNVTLNLYGGTIGNAFGGSDANGNIAGTITVNVMDKNVCHPLDVTNIFGASNLTAYNPDDVTSGVKPVSPVVNVIHIAQTPGIRENVYGGGNEATVTANPKVNIGYHHASMAQYIPLDANGDSLYHVPSTSRAYVTGNVFGGGNQAGVMGNPVVNMRNKGTVISGIYGGCNTQGTITGDINVNIYGGGLGTSDAPMTEGIFGGGKGGYESESNRGTKTDGNITVTIGDGTIPTVYADIYGGSAFGEVGDANKLAKVWLKNGTVHGTIFGGGKGDGSHAATVSGATEVAMEGGLVRGTVISGSGSDAVTGAVFGGCNVNGIVLGDATVSYTGGTIGATDDYANTYGGGLGPNTKVKGDVDVTVNGSGVNVYGDVYGGSAKGKVNCNEAGDGANDGSTTDVTLTNGTVHGDLYGGGHGPDGTENADVYGPITVKVEGGTATTVFGCNNQSGTPKSTVTVDVEGGSVTNVYGGGNVAAYIPTTSNTNYPAVNIKGGVVTNKVVGGGDAADIGSSSISCNPMVTISGGNVCTALTNAGVYGGCNTSGTVYGNITVNITKAHGNTTIGTQAALDYAQQNTLVPVSVHGGGFGDGTSTNGNITVNYGTVAYDDITHEEINTEYPKLYGDLYGGSALGTVNSASASPANTTTVNVMNGSFVYKRVGYDQYGGNIYGGGRGEAGPSNVNKGKVNGVVHVNIGDGEKDSNNYTINRTGKADLKGCNVFGCNNTNGSPQKDVYVDVYQTKHDANDLVNYQGNDWFNYAIRNVYGGGNKAHFTPANNNLTHNTVHACDNTIEYVYGGGNAADTYGTEVSVDGGRFKYIFGGGNGQSIAANIGDGGVRISVYGGHVGWYFSGCNLHGTIGGGNPIEQYGCATDYCPCGNTLEVENYYFGANEAVTVGGLSHIINCGDNMNFTNVYGGSRLAVVYGDIKLWVRGGTIANLFAGNEGSDEVQADVKKYPAAGYNWTTNPDGHPIEVKNYLEGYTDEHGTVWPAHHDQYGQGGNIQLVLEGGQLGNVYGGNDYRGNVEGNIVIIVDSTQASPCQLNIDYLYGGNKKSGYTPDSCLVDEHNVVCLTDRVSPQVYLKHGHVNYDVYGGSEGGDPSHQYGNGNVVSNPKVVIGDPSVSGHKARVGRDVFGGGSAANMTGDPKVVVQGKATVEGSVYGGGREGDVDGSTDVKIAPTTTVTPPVTPTPPSHKLYIETDGSGTGTVSVIYYQNNVVHSVNNGDDVPEGTILHILATPAAGSSFSLWWTDYGNLEQPTHASTQCMMGPRDTTLKATFVSE